MTCRECMYFDTWGVCTYTDPQKCGAQRSENDPACEDFKVFEINDDCEECRL